MKHVHLDFETACELDLPTVGLHRYIEHPSFKVLCLAWKSSMGNPVVTRMDDSRGLPPELHALLSDDKVQGCAWNAAFEEKILETHYQFRPARRLSCTMQRAYSYGLPGALERAGRALGCRWTKDMSAHRLMKRMAKDPTAWWTEAEWATLMAYCVQDVRSEEEIAGLIPQLSHQELELSRVDRIMNNTGIWCDTGMVRTLMDVAQQAEKIEATRAAELSGGQVTSPGTQTERLTKWLQDQGLAITDVSRPAVEEALTNIAASDSCGLPCAEVEEMLRIRLRVARASVKKLNKMLQTVSSGDRLRGQFQFLGAARTGRWAGRGVQCQNLPRVPPGFSPLDFVKMARVDGGEGLDAVAQAPILDCVSWSLRACLGAQTDKGLWAFDFSQIEARVLAWLSGQTDVLKVFRSGEDIYMWCAQQFGSQNRQLGKVLILALGFGMGARKLRETAQKIYAVRMTEDEAVRFKEMWRRQNRRIVTFWSTIEHAARAAILQKGKILPVSPSTITLQASAKTLQMRLPSGRYLYYHKPCVGADGAISYMGEQLGQWVERRTWGGVLTENAVQAVARDLMTEAMLRVSERTGAAPLLCIHDEIVYRAGNNTEALEKLVHQAPSWAADLPIAGKAKTMARYGVVSKE